MTNRRPGPARHAIRIVNRTRTVSTALPVTIHLVAPYGAGRRLDAYLGQYLPEHSRSEWQRLVENGSVTLNAQPTKAAARLQEGDRLEIRPVAAHALLEPDPTITLDVLHEDAAIVVLDKPAGLVVHPAPGHESGTLVHALLARFPELQDPTGQKRPGIVHRLDKDTSGVMVVGKTPEAVAFLQRQMQQGKIHKRYRLLVVGTIQEDEGIIEAPIGRDRVNRQKMAVRADGRTARTEFRVLERLPGFTYVDAGLPSGRTHQLRVHFGYIGHPVAGDRTYGRGRAPGRLERQFVHSHELTLTSPVGKTERTFVAELPPDLEAALAALRELAGIRASITAERAS
ncbi:MAG: rRNA synthase [Chloroflexota bacterium]|jgi:23S rRNA pseudouridine1911/1915/1917 synthase|nr:rRNA synthase [Chloroflexota bacterium]